MPTMSFISHCRDSHNVSLLHFIGRPLFRLFGMNAINSCLGNSDTGPWTIFPRNCIVLILIVVCTLGILLNLIHISSTVILCFITCHRLILIIFLTFLLTNPSNFLGKSMRKAQLSHLQSNRLMGMAIKTNYFEYTLALFLLKKSFKAPINLPAAKIHISTS